MDFAEKEKNRKSSGVGVVGKLISTPKEQQDIDKIVVVPPKEEPRSKRVNLLIQPSLHEKAQMKCREMGISFNECINQLLSVWTQEGDK